MVHLRRDHLLVMVDDSEDELWMAHTCFQMAKLSNPWQSFSTVMPFMDYLSTAKRGTAALPGLVLLDINMPQLSGFDVLDKIRSDTGLASALTIALFTNSENPRDRDKAIRLGAAGIFVKPPDIDSYVRFFVELARPE